MVAGDEEAASGKEDERNCDCSTGCLAQWAMPLFCILIFVACLAAFFWVGPSEVLRWCVSFVPENPKWEHVLAVCAVVGICVILSIPLWPPLCMVIALIWGFWKGFLMIFLTITISSMMAFFLGRTCLKEKIRPWIMEGDYTRIRRMMLVIEHDEKSLKFLILFRFLHISLAIRNYVPSILEVPAWHMFVSVCLHTVWVALIFAAVGSSLKNAAEVLRKGGDLSWEHIEWWQWSIFALALAATLLISWYAYREYNKALEEEEKESLTQGGN